MRKYIFFFDLFITMALYLYYKLLNTSILRLFNNKDRKDTIYFFINSPFDVFNLQKAMIEGHSSQMKWFRWLYIFTSRYMLLNELKKK